jgi:hypothetical protein
LSPDSEKVTLEEAKEMALQSLVKELELDKATDRIRAAEKILEIGNKGPVQQSINFHNVSMSDVKELLSGVKEIASSGTTGDKE